MKRLIPLVILVFLIAPSSVQAQTIGGFGLRPKEPTQAYFRFTAEPGQVIEDTLMAINDTESAMTLTVAVSRASTALTGGLAFDGTLPKEGEAGRWLTMALVPGEVEIPAHSAVELPFAIKVPTSVQPGEYAFGFIATPTRAADATPSGSGFQVQVVSQAAVSVLITIPGAETPSAVVRDVVLVEEAEIERLVVTLANEGAVGWQGQGAFTLKSSKGEAVIEREFQVGYVLPGDSIPYPLALDGPLPAGSYRAEVTLDDDQGPFTKTIEVAELITPQTDLISPTQPSANASPNLVPSADSASDSPFAASNTPEDLLPLALFIIGLVAVSGISLYAFFSRRKSK